MSARLRRVRLRSQGCRDRGVHSLTHPSRVACLALIPMWHTESQPPPLPLPPPAPAPAPPPPPPAAARLWGATYQPVGGNKEQRTPRRAEWEMAGLPCCVHKHATAAAAADPRIRCESCSVRGRRQEAWMGGWSLWWWSSSSLPTPLPMPFVLSLYVFCCHVQVFFSVYEWLESSRSMTFKAKVDRKVFENVGVYWHAGNRFRFVSFFSKCWASLKKKVHTKSSQHHSSQ